jgi:hypothetical protein
MSPFRRPIIGCLVLLAAVRAASAAEVTLNATDLIRLPTGVYVVPSFALPEEDTTLPVVAPNVAGEAAERLRALDGDGRAGGFSGVLYDNRDRGHSALATHLFPRLARLAYGFELMAEDMDYGLAGAVVLPLAVFGNSSTAITGGDAPRSLVRHAMTRPGLPETQARLYESNHLYVYPEHRDHDAVDLYPANWPFTVTSQGSSGSDRPFLEAFAMTIAAFPEATFARLLEEGLVAPTLQMILRRSLSPVRSDEDYLSPSTHPAVFDARFLRPDRMVEAAAALRPEDIPPMIRLSVIEEDFRAEAGLALLDERLFDTPSAIARVWRDFAWEREMVISAAATTDPNGRPLSFSWRLLQGLPDRVEIEPLDAEGRTARLRVRWHDTFAVVQGGVPRAASRVDIGVFASNGAVLSAPAILSISFPTHQQREYGLSEDGEVRLISADYDAIGRGVPFDPTLHWSAPWSDRAIRDDVGIVAWERTQAEGVHRVVEHGRAGGYRIDRVGRRAVLAEVPITPLAEQP